MRALISGQLAANVLVPCLFVIFFVNLGRVHATFNTEDNVMPGHAPYATTACENAIVITKAITISKDNPIEVITTPAAARDCPVSMKVTYRWGQWDHPLFPQITKDPDLSVRFGTTTGGYFPMPRATCDGDRVCSSSYSGVPESVKKEPVYYLVRLEYNFFRMVINNLPFVGTDTVECDVEISYSPCINTPFLTLEPSDLAGTAGKPSSFTATLHNWDFSDAGQPEIVYEWYVEGMKKYESRDRVAVSRITHTFETAGDKTIRVHVVPASAQDGMKTLKPLFREQLVFKVSK
jgi:hypothetical protein